MDRETKQIFANILKKEIGLDVRDAILHIQAFKKEWKELGIGTIFSREKAEWEDDVNDIGKFHDYRIKWIALKNFRSVPYSGEGKPYGLRFEDARGGPVSAFLVGRNSSGKTTVYSALEHHYVSANSMATDMDLNRDDILTYGFGQLDNITSETPELTVSTLNGTTTEHLSTKTNYCSPAPFCSEYDLHQLGVKGYDLKEYILEQLGYGELKIIKTRLNKIIADKKEEIDQSKNKDWSELDLSDLNEIIKYFVRYADEERAKIQLDRIGVHGSLFNRDYSERTAGKTKVYIFTKDWDILDNLSANEKKERKDLVTKASGTAKEGKSKRTSKDQVNKLKKMYDLLEDNLRLCSKGEDGMIEGLTNLYQKRITIDDKGGQRVLDEKGIEEAETTKAILESVVSLIEDEEKGIINLFKAKRFKMIVDILKIFSNNEGEMFIKEWESASEKDRLTIMIKDKDINNKPFEATPQEFYNSFRYKLYAVSFKIALAFMEMKLKNIRVPIVIDDVFNASDFENNIRLEYFVYNIYLAYSTMNFSEPLQLILFTHDEMVQAAFRKGSNMVVVKEKKVEETADDGKPIQLFVDMIPKGRKPRNYICGRLFNWNYAAELEKDMIENDGADDEKKVTISAEYYNLYMDNS